MSRPIRWFDPLALVAMIFATVPLAADSFSSEHAADPYPRFVAGCQRVQIESPPEWVSDLLWVPEISKILITDTELGELRTYDPSGAMADRFAWGAETPGFVERFGTDYLALRGRADLTWLDDRFANPRDFDFKTERRADDQWYFSSIWGKQLAVADGSLVGIGGLRNERTSEKSPWLGVFAYPLPWLGDRLTPEAPTRILSLNGGRSDLRAGRVDDRRPAMDAALRMLYRFDMPFIAAIGQRAFVVELGAEPRLLAYDTKKRQLESLGGLPRELASPTEGHAKHLSQDTVTLFGELERMTMPAGLYAVDGFLYLAHRSPSERVGETLWRMAKLDPRGDRVKSLGVVTLPTTSAHIDIVPAGERWMIFEKGTPNNPKINARGEKIDVFNVASAIVLPSRNITEPETSPLRGLRADVVNDVCIDR